MKKWLVPSLLFSFLLSCGGNNRYTSQNKPEFREEDVLAAITLLASDSLQGRDTGSEGEAFAADFITREFQAFGVKPAGSEGGYFQEFTVVKGSLPSAEGSRLSAGDLLFSSADSSVFPYTTSSPGEASGLLAFVGYGIVDSTKKWNDYAGLDVRGHVVLIFRYGPDGADNPHSAFADQWSLRRKIRNAVDRGAVAVLLVLGPKQAGKEEILSMKEDRFAAEAGVPVLQLKLSAATQLAAQAGISLTTAQASIDKTMKPASKATGMGVVVSAGIQKDRRVARNVIGLIPGTEFPNRYVVVGAHYDHLGFGDHGSLYSGKEPKIHNGADDNASGTAGLLELAAWFAKNPPKHSLVLMAFSGEEMGLLGSDYWVKNPTLPLEHVRAMINMDMIGRMTNNTLQIFGTGSSADWATLIDGANTDSLRITKTPDGTGASDHTSFYNAKIPVLHYFTGTHSDYHRPTDDTQYINFSGLVQTLHHVRRVVEGIDGLPSDKLAFTEAPVTQTRRMAMSGYTLGVLPDYGFSGPGFRITGTSEGKLGAKMGLKAGDVIININGMNIKDIYDYMESLNSLKKGGTVQVTVLRDGKPLTVQTAVE